MGPSALPSSSDASSGRPRLAVVIVNYRSWGDVATLVGSLAGSPLVGSGACEIVVVDNASGRPVPAALRGPKPGVRLILRADNGGFSRGVNAGWRSSSAPWLLVLNPDVVPDADLLDRVVDRLDAPGRRGGRPAGVVGFALRNPDGSRQPSVGAFPTLVRTAWEQVIPRARRKYQPDRLVRPGPVDWVTGACFLVAAPLLAELGGMDEDFFLYYEEVALCREASRRGWAVEFDPSIAVTHLRPLQNRAISSRMRVVTRHSKLLYFRKHLPRWQFAALAVVVAAEARARAGWCRLLGRPGARAWRAVGEVARRLRAGDDLGGIEVLALADAADDAPDPDDEGGPRPAPPRTRIMREVAGRR